MYKLAAGLMQLGAALFLAGVVAVPLLGTGALLPFAPKVNGVIKAVAASPDGSRIYIGGSFNNVNGKDRWNIAAIDAKSATSVTSQFASG